MKAKLLILGILVILGIRTIFNVFSSQMIDFSAYMSTTQTFLSGQNPYLTTPLSLLYPPASLLFFLPFSVFPYLYAKTFWTIISLISLFLALHLIFQKYKDKISKLHLPAPEMFFLLFILQLFPVKFSLAQGQINGFVLLGFVLLYYLIQTKKPILTGLVLAIIVNLKFLPIFFVLYLLLTKQYKSTLYFAFFYLISNITINLFSPIDLNTSFISQTFLRSTRPPLAYYNQSLTALLYRLGLERISNYLNIALLSLTSISVLCKPKNNSLIFSLFLCCILLISPITWQHYLFWTIPIFLVIFPQKLNFVSVLTTISFVLININIKSPEQYSSNQLLYSHATVGLIVLYCLLLFLSFRLPMRTLSQPIH